MYFDFHKVNPELRAMCPPIDAPGKVVTWKKTQYFLAWHTRFGVYVARVQGERHARS